MDGSEDFVNQTEEDIDHMHFMYENRNFNWKITSIFIASYALVVIPGLIANILIFMAVVKKPILMTPLNILISNLALSDCLLCVVNVPSTLIEICCIYWPLRDDFDGLCKFFGLSQGLLIFVSTITIVVIAVDRYQIMFYPTEKKLTGRGAVKAIFFIWILSFGLALPLCLMRKLEKHLTDLPDLKYVATCIEDWPEKGRTYYSIFSLIIQYLLPFVVISYTYTKIYLKVNRGNSMARQECERERRLKKTNSLLVAMALAHCISWLPLNILNLIGDLYEDYFKNISREVYYVIFFLCHLMGMSTVITNPLLYGYYNDNFRKACLEMTAFKFLKKNGYVSDIPYTVEDEGGDSNMVRLTDNTMTTMCKTDLSEFYKKKLKMKVDSIDDTSV